MRKFDWPELMLRLDVGEIFLITAFSIVMFFVFKWSFAFLMGRLDFGRDNELIVSTAGACFFCSELSRFTAIFGLALCGLQYYGLAS